MQPTSSSRRSGERNCGVQYARLAKACPLDYLKQSLLMNCQLCKHVLIACAALVASVYSTWGWRPSQHVGVAHGLLLFALGGSFFTALFRCAHAAIAQTEWGVRRLVKAHQLSASDVLDIANKIVSSTQALFCCITGYVVVAHSCCEDVAHANHFVSHAYAWFGAAYFFYDIWSMYVVHVSATSARPASFLRYVRRNPIIVAHHLFIGIFGFAVIVHLRGNLGDCVFGFVYLMEASTPLVSVRGVLARFHLKHTRAYIYNGFFMLLVFFLCRVAMFPYVVHLYAISTRQSFVEVIYALPTGCKLSMGILMVPQIYWFLLMIKGATKIIIRVATPLAPVAPSLGGDE